MAQPQFSAVAIASVVTEAEQAVALGQPLVIPEGQPVALLVEMFKAEPLDLQPFPVSSEAAAVS